jgi:5-methylthioribose kinase
MNACYPILTEATVADYLRRSAQFAGLVDADTVVAREVGDGNLNLVFICNDERGASMVLKQSLPYVRAAGPSWPLSADRSHAEATGLRAAARASPATTPQLYGYDEQCHVLAMEDLSALTVWRRALNDGTVSAHAASDCARHVARLLFHTGVVGLDPEQFRAAAARSTNPTMCRITEDLIFTEPFTEHPNNRFPAAIRTTVDSLRSDRRLSRRVTNLKVEFETRAESLLHGDLHTGSVMVGPECRSTKVIDPEFCFYGPVAFDLGLLLGNLLFASVRAKCLGLDRQRRDIDELPGLLWAGFTDEFWSSWPNRRDRSLCDDFATDWLTRIAADSIGFAACEVIRRVVGFAKVSDLESLPHERYGTAVTTALEVAHRWLTTTSPVWSDALFRS